MAALSDYLESIILNFIFRGGTFTKPSNVSVALLNEVPKDNDDGSTMAEVLNFITNEAGAEVSTQYARASLGDPSENGNTKWSDVGDDPSSVYYTHTENLPASGFYYPLYLEESRAVQASDGNGVESYVFPEHPATTFYKPLNVGAINATTNPDPDEIIYRFYDGNGFIQNKSNITFEQAGKGGWGTIKAVALMDSDTYGEGNILMYAPLEVEKSVGEGDIVQFIPSQLEISLK